MTHAHHASALAVAGGHGLPGGRLHFLSRKAFLFYVLASLILAVPMATMSSLLRSEPAASVASFPDPRPLGQRAVEDAQARLLRATTDARAMTQLASAYLQRARETGDPTYYARADALVSDAYA